MSQETQTPLGKLIQSVRTLKGKGFKNVNLEILEKALLEAEESKKDDETLLSRFHELQHASNLATYRESQEFNRTMFRAAMEFAGGALKSALLINGGAAVAILAYLGSRNSHHSEDFSNALAAYTIGVLVSAVATGAAYFAQLAFTENHDRRGNVYRIVAIIFILGSYAAFGTGGWLAYAGFNERGYTTTRPATIEDTLGPEAMPTPLPPDAKSDKLRGTRSN
ncbi:MAG TPA: hypothetical protein VGM64_20925 [Lacunisphaera sp.]|jgi:hypothetical protein